MPVSKRRELVNYVIAQLQEIDGQASPFDSNYTFATVIHPNNVSRGWHNIEDINDFPYITVEAGPERYTYQTAGNTEGHLELLLRCYLHNGDRSILSTDVDNLIQDIDHIVYKMSTQVDNFQTVHVGSVDDSQDLLVDYGIVEIKLILKYELGFI